MEEEEMKREGESEGGVLSDDKAPFLMGWGVGAPGTAFCYSRKLRQENVSRNLNLLFFLLVGFVLRVLLATGLHSKEAPTAMLDKKSYMCRFWCSVEFVCLCVVLCHPRGWPTETARGSGSGG